MRVIQRGYEERAEFYELERHCRLRTLEESNSRDGRKVAVLAVLGRCRSRGKNYR